MNENKANIPPIGIPHCCPVCCGKGFVLNGFYSTSSKDGLEKCRSCDGKGYIVCENRMCLDE